MAAVKSVPGLKETNTMRGPLRNAILGVACGITANASISCGRLAGDSVSGTIVWYSFPGVASQYFQGTVVARRQP